MIEAPHPRFFEREGEKVEQKYKNEGYVKSPEVPIFLRFCQTIYVLFYMTGRNLLTWRRNFNKIVS